MVEPSTPRDLIVGLLSIGGEPDIDKLFDLIVSEAVTRLYFLHCLYNFPGWHLLAHPLIRFVQNRNHRQSFIFCVDYGFVGSKDVFAAELMLDQPTVLEFVAKAPWVTSTRSSGRPRRCWSCRVNTSWETAYCWS